MLPLLVDLLAMEEVTTHETQPEGVDVTPADGVGTDAAGNISLDDLNTVLGKNYKSLDAALAGVKETVTYAGKLSGVKNVLNQAQEKLQTDEQGVLSALTQIMENNQVPTPQASTEGFMSRNEYQEEKFFDTNPQLHEIRSVLKPLKDADANTKSMSWTDFVQSESAKKVIEPFVGYQEVQAKKSVLESNPRLGIANDRISTARAQLDSVRESERAGDVTAAHQSLSQAKDNAVQSVLEAYGL